MLSVMAATLAALFGATIGFMLADGLAAGASHDGWFGRHRNNNNRQPQLPSRDTDGARKIVCADVCTSVARMLLENSKMLLHL